MEFESLRATVDLWVILSSCPKFSLSFVVLNAIKGDHRKREFSHLDYSAIKYTCSQTCSVSSTVMTHQALQ